MSDLRNRSKTSKSRGKFLSSTFSRIKGGLKNTSQGYLILYIPFDPLWLFFIRVSTAFECLYVIFETSHYFASSALDDSMDIIIYSFDALYAVDVILITCYKFVRKKINLPFSHAVRPTWIFIFEIISLIPFELFFIEDSVTTLLRLVKTLRIIRILSFFYYQNHALKINIAGKLLIHIYIYFLFSMIVYNVTYHLLCYYDDCTQEDFYVKHFVAVVGIASCQGFAQMRKSVFDESLVCIYLYLAFFFLYSLNMSFLVIDYTHSQTHISTFQSHLYKTMDSLKAENVSKEISNLMFNFYVSFWTERLGYNDNYSFEYLLPYPMYQEMLLDAFWVPFKHSCLFKDIDLSFGRFLAMFMKSKFMLAGEIIYKRNVLKTKMIYVASGIIDIISEQDGKTPILSFSCGTVLGESSLFVSYESLNIVRCRNFCEIVILEKKDLLKAIAVYPRQYNHFREEVNKRYEFSKKFARLSEYFYAGSKMESQYRNATITWIKNTLHELMTEDAHTSKHQHTNIYLTYENHDVVSNLLFTAKYLSLYAITERLELFTDEIFLTNSWPYILQPNSVFLRFWEYIVLLHVSLAMVIIPKYFFFVFHTDGLKTICFYYLLKITWTVDFILKTCTAVFTKENVEKTVTDIFFYRMKTTDYIADFGSLIPMEWFSALLAHSSDSQTNAMLQLNRLFKVYRIHLFFNRLENRLDVNFRFVLFFKYACILAYSVYICAKMTFAINCKYMHHCNYYAGQYSEYFPAIQIITGIGLVTKWDLKYNVNYILILFISMGCLFIFMSYVSQAVLYSLEYKNTLEVQSLTSDFRTVLQKSMISQENGKRVMAYIRAQWINNTSIELIEHTSRSARIPAYMFENIREACFAQQLRNTKLFAGLEESIIGEICVHLTEIVLPPHEVVCYVEAHCTHLYILTKGICNIGCPNKELLPGEIICLLEAFYDLPILKTVVCKTYCRFICLNLQVLSQIYTKYPNYFEEYKILIKKTEDIGLAASKLPNDSISYEHWERKSMEFDSYFEFPKLLEPNSFMEYEYYNPFDKSYFFAWTKYFLLKRTFIPGGQFLFYHEIFRSLFSILSVIIFTAHWEGTCQACNVHFVRSFLDCTALYDMYIRLHIAYYNEEGILVIHPYKTAEYYLKHGFTIDFLGVLPFSLVINADRIKDASMLRYFNGNRLLQLHRFIQLRHWIHNFSMESRGTYVILTLIPLTIVYAAVIGSFAFTNECHFHATILGKYNYADGVKCSKSSIWSRSNFTKLDGLHIEIYAVFIATSLLTSTGIQGFNIETYNMGFIVSLVSIIGYFYTVNRMSEVISIVAFNNPRAMEFKEHIVDLKIFMHLMKVPKEKRSKIIDYYNLTWNREHGQNFFKLTKYFHKSLKEDLLYEMYGARIIDYIIFPVKHKEVFKNIILSSRILSVPSGGEIIALNDVNSDIFIITRGLVDIYSSTGEFICTLGTGSMFGNLDETEFSRMDIRAIAQNHVEVAYLNSIIFYNLFCKHSDLVYLISYNVTMHKFYIPSVIDYNKLTIQYHESNYVISSSNRLFAAIELINVVVSCFICLCLDFYNLTMNVPTFELMVCLYICDFFYVVFLFLRYHTSYQDELGYDVKDIQKVRNYHINRSKYKWRFYTDIFGALPAEAFCEFFGSLNAFRYLRLNRIVRLFNIEEYFTQRRNVLGAAQEINEVIYIFMWSFLVLHGFTCSFICTCCLFPENTFPPMLCLEKYTLAQRYELYIRHLLIILNIFTKSAQNSFFPASTIVTLLLIFVMIFMLLISSLFYAQVFYVIYINFYARARYTQRWLELKYFMEKERVASAIVEKISKYVHKLWLRSRGILLPKLLRTAPKFLQEEIYMYLAEKEIMQHPIFCNFHADLIRQMLPKVKQMVLYPGDYVTFQDDVNETTFFVKSGVINAIDLDLNFIDETVVSSYKSGDIFCIYNGLGHGKSNYYNYKSEKNSVLLCLTFSSWEYLMDYFPSSKQYFNDFKMYYTY